jgi:hypothetical protein
MPDHEFKSFANQVLDENPELRKAMAESEGFAELKSRCFLDEVGGHNVYSVNDTQGDEDALYVDALAKGVKRLRKNRSEKQTDDIYRKLYLELDERLRSMVEKTIAGGDV